MATLGESYPQFAEQLNHTTEGAVRLLYDTIDAQPSGTVTRDELGILVTGTAAGVSVELSHPTVTDTRWLFVNQPSAALLADLVFARGVRIAQRTRRVEFNIRADRVEVATLRADRRVVDHPSSGGHITTISAASFERLVQTGLFCGEVSKARRLGLGILSIFLK